MVNKSFEWDEIKNLKNIAKHGVSFVEAQEAFYDESRIITRNEKHSVDESRYFCTGKIKKGIVTVRFTFRKDKIRIIGAGFWRKERKDYEKKSKIY